MYKLIDLIILISLISLKLAIGTESSSIIFPGKYFQNIHFKPLNFNLHILFKYTGSVSSKNDDYRNTDMNQDWNTNSRTNQRQVDKSFSRKNNQNSIDKHGEESRISEKQYNLKASSFDDLPYDFSKTDKIHKVSDLLRFLGIEDKNKNNDDGGLMTRKVKTFLSQKKDLNQNFSFL